MSDKIVCHARQRYNFLESDNVAQILACGEYFHIVSLSILNL
jgi:hypothetical protein